jgi:phosphoglycolate phosphatase
VAIKSTKIPVLFRAIIFDMDGTLLDTLADIATATNRVLTAHGLPTHQVEAYRYFIGDGARMLIRRVLPQNGPGPHQPDEDLVQACLEDFETEYSRNWRQNTRPYPGVTDLLDSLVKRHIPIAILSNKPDSFTQSFVRELLSDWPFAVVAGHRIGIALKPDPAGALAVAKQLNQPPFKILFLGDSCVDMQTAVAAGMYPVGACWGFRPRRELLESGARALIDHPRQLPGLLSQTPGKDATGG